MNTKSTSQTLYDKHFNDIKLMQQKLTNLIDGHRVEFERSGSRDWGYTGDLGHVYELLQEAVAFLSDEPIETPEK